MDKFIKIEFNDRFGRRIGYDMINVDRIKSFKVSEKSNKIVLRFDDKSNRKFNFRHFSDLEGFVNELISKIDSKNNKFDPDMRIEKQN